MAALVTDHLHLVRRIARYYSGRGLDIDDLIQAGSVGLVYAAQRYDAARHCSFATYATYWIKREIARAIENESRTVRLPAWIQRDRTRREDCARYAVYSLDEPVADDDGATLKDMLSDNGAPSPFDVAARNETRREVLAMLERLNPREREIIVRRFGLDGEDTMNLPQIGRAIGLSKQRVQVIEQTALSKLRRMRHVG